MSDIVESYNVDKTYSIEFLGSLTLIDYTEDVDPLGQLVIPQLIRQDLVKGLGLCAAVCAGQFDEAPVLGQQGHIPLCLPAAKQPIVGSKKKKVEYPKILGETETGGNIPK